MDIPKIDILWGEIEKNYDKKQRKYHNLTHLEELFNHFDVYIESLNTPDEVAFAIFYHDIVYSIWEKDNEEKSAELAVRRLSDIVISSDTIYKHIIATKTHEGITNDAKFMIDFDLAILGQSEEVYQKYAKLIRQEYRLIPSMIYKKGRIQVLQHFLDKKTIYQTDTFINLYEENARKNIQNELNELQNGIK